MTRPERMSLLGPMLEGTRRVAVPLRRSFIQKGTRSEKRKGSQLAALARDSAALDAYLLIHAMASSSSPYSAFYPAATWVQIARLDEAASLEAAKTHWSKLVSRLESLGLIKRQRRGNQMDYLLLDESGSGAPYARPKQTSDGIWFSLPYDYWLGGYDAAMQPAEKIMLLIALDQLDDFSVPMDKVSSWYGISEATARRGFRGLEERALLTRTSDFVASPRSPTGWVEELRYTLQGPFSRSAREAANKGTRSPKVNIKDGEGI